MMGTPPSSLRPQPNASHSMQSPQLRHGTLRTPIVAFHFKPELRLKEVTRLQLVASQTSQQRSCRRT